MNKTTKKNTIRRIKTPEEKEIIKVEKQLKKANISYTKKDIAFYKDKLSRKFKNVATRNEYLQTLSKDYKATKRLEKKIAKAYTLAPYLPQINETTKQQIIEKAKKIRKASNVQYYIKHSIDAQKALDYTEKNSKIARRDMLTGKKIRNAAGEVIYTKISKLKFKDYNMKAFYTNQYLRRLQEHFGQSFTSEAFVNEFNSLMSKTFTAAEIYAMFSEKLDQLDHQQSYSSGSYTKLIELLKATGTESMMFPSDQDYVDEAADYFSSLAKFVVYVLSNY